MKVTFQTDAEMNGLVLDLINGIVVSRLKEAVEDCKSFNTHPGDKKYNKKFSAAAKIIIEYFGG